jgi:hypothetical protein
MSSSNWKYKSLYQHMEEGKKKALLLPAGLIFYLSIMLERFKISFFEQMRSPNTVSRQYLNSGSH